MKLNAYWALLVLVLLLGAFAGQVFVKAADNCQETKATQLAVVWTSGDADVAHKMCLMYTHAAKNNKWFDEVTLVVWGPSSRLLAGDKELQSKIKEMMASGIVVEACVVCADMYGVSEELREMGITVKGMGKPLSDMLKDGWKTLTF